MCLSRRTSFPTDTRFDQVSFDRGSFEKRLLLRMQTKVNAPNDFRVQIGQKSALYYCVYLFVIFPTLVVMGFRIKLCKLANSSVL